MHRAFFAAAVVMAVAGLAAAAGEPAGRAYTSDFELEARFGLRDRGGSCEGCRPVIGELRQELGELRQRVDRLERYGSGQPRGSYPIPYGTPGVREYSTPRPDPYVDCPTCPQQRFSGAPAGAVRYSTFPLSRRCP